MTGKWRPLVNTPVSVLTGSQNTVTLDTYRAVIWNLKRCTCINGETLWVLSLI